MARNKELNQKMKDERREQILHNALILFATKGLAATKITDISTKSGISQGLLYHYFNSKEVIFVELVKHALNRMNEACLELEKLSASPGEKVRMALEELFAGFDRNKDASYYYYLILQATISEAIPLEAKDVIEGHSNIPYEVMERIFLEGQKDGSVKDYNAKDLSVIFWSSIKGIALSRTSFGKRSKMPEVEILIETFLNHPNS